MKISIIDYSMGNLHSVAKKLSRLGCEVKIARSANELKAADKIILPGVGHFAKAMQNLQSLDLTDVLNEMVLVKKTPILGICLGMQLMASYSEEGNVAGLGWFSGMVERFKVSDSVLFKVPHMGWNQVEIQKNSSLMKNVDDCSEFYFVHSFHYVGDNQDDILNTSTYDYRFISAIEKHNIFGVQYHPEKSHMVGEQLLKNFITL